MSEIEPYETREKWRGRYEIKGEHRVDVEQIIGDIAVGIITGTSAEYAKIISFGESSHAKRSIIEVVDCSMDALRNIEDHINSNYDVHCMLYCTDLAETRYGWRKSNEIHNIELRTLSGRMMLGKRRWRQGVNAPLHFTKRVTLRITTREESKVWIGDSMRTFSQRVNVLREEYKKVSVVENKPDPDNWAVHATLIVESECFGNLMDYMGNIYHTVYLEDVKVIDFEVFDLDGRPCHLRWERDGLWIGDCHKGEAMGC